MTNKEMKAHYESLTLSQLFCEKGAMELSKNKKHLRVIYQVLRNVYKQVSK